MLVRGLLLSVLVSCIAFPDEAKSPALTPEEQKLAGEATRLSSEAAKLRDQGQAAAVVEKLRQALEIRQKLYPTSKFADGHIDVAVNLNNLGFALHAMAQPEEALPFYQQSLAMYRKLFPDSRHADGHPSVANSLSNLGFGLQATGQMEQALNCFQESLDITRRLYPPSRFSDGHPDVARNLNNMGTALQMAGQADKALGFFQQGLEMRRKLYSVSRYPDGHPYLVQSLSSTGSVLRALGQMEKALPYYEQSLEMLRKFYPVSKYPDGHTDLAATLNNLGLLLEAMGQPEKALTYFQPCLAMTQKLYPAAKYSAGHPILVLSLNSMGLVLRALGQMHKALDCHQQGLDMCRLLYPSAKYPDGHPYLALSLNNMALVLQEMGQVEKAVTIFRQSLGMNQTLYTASNYPDGHSDVVVSLGNLGSALQKSGQTKQALHCFHQSLKMQQRLLQRELITASESAAFDLVAAQPLMRDAYLSVTRAENVPARDCYKVIAPSRSVVTRILEQRLASAHLAGTAIAGQIDRLQGNRRRIDQLVRDTRMNKEQRDRLLVKYADERDTLERELLRAMPHLKRSSDLDELGPETLAQALPPGAVFVDIIRYEHVECVGNKENRTPCYVAFVIPRSTRDMAPGSGGGMTRVELDNATPIDAAVHKWRAAIDSRRDESKAVAELKRLVWDRIASALPSGSTTLFLATDGDLSRLPWAALPIGRDRILLDQYALAHVPHGVFLQEQLQSGKKPGGDNTLLTLADVDYGMGVWPALPGTVAEAKAIAAIAPGQRAAIGGKDATPGNLKLRLSGTRYIHLATHGEFNADALAAEKKRAAKAMESRLHGDDSRRIAAKNPLAYVGLVLTNGEVLSGLGIVDLRLQNSHLVTLSACETGLGDYTGGEGVQGLQRAFHLAGCPNVVASLWKVNDAATAALMAKFYHEMWVNKIPPIEALREAQLTIYRHPELIPDLAGERGPVRVKEAVTVRAGSVSDGKQKRADTKLWAAFVLSGVGK